MAEADDGGHVVHARPGTAVLEALLGRDVVDELLAWHDQRSPRLRAVRDGAPQSPDVFVQPHRTWAGTAARVQVGRLVAELTAGTTVALDGTDEIHPRIAAAAEHLERVFAAHVLANVYVSAGERSGTGRHWDDHDVLVLQLDGAKRWEVRRPARAVPLRSFVPDESPGGETVFDDVLAPGDVLYLPRGHVHLVTPTGGASTHLTFGITRQRGVDVLARLVNEAGQDAAFRHDVPAGDDGAADRLGADVARLLADRADDLVRAGPASIRSRATTRFSAMRQALVDGRWDGLTARLSLPGGLWVESGGSSDEVVLAGARRRWAVRRHAFPAIGRLLAADPVPVADLALACPSGGDCSRTLVAQLAVDGVGELDRDDSVP